MQLLRAAWLNAVALHRGLGLWLPGILALWIVVTKLQEPPLLRRQGVPLFWGSVHAILLAVASLLPLIQRLADGPATAGHLRPSSTFRLVMTRIFGITIYGSGTILAATLLAFSLDRMLGGAGAGPAAITVSASSLAFLLVTASVSGLVPRRRNAAMTVAIWLLVLGTCLVVLRPHSLCSASNPGQALADILTVLQAALGGLLLSVAASIPRRKN